MVMAHNPTCVSILVLAATGSRVGEEGGGAVRPSFEAKPLESLIISVILGFQIVFPCIIL